MVILFLIGCTNQEANKKPSITKKDSVEIWIQQSTSRKLTLNERKKALEKAFENSKAVASDSTRLQYLSEIAIEAEALNIVALFKKVNSENLSLATQLKDTFKIGDAHWNYGSYYTRKESLDTAYYHYHKAYESFKAIHNEKFTARMLYNLGNIQGKIKDYTGSEISLIEAIEIFKKFELNTDSYPRYESLNTDFYRTYNYLGLIYIELEEFDRSIFYLNTALRYLEKIENKKTYKQGSLNNLGLAYQEKKDYNKAIANFEKALRLVNLKRLTPSLYARLIDNIAYTKLLSGDTLNVLEGFNTSLKIRDSLNNVSGKVLSKKHLSEFYAFKKDTLQAISNAKQAYDFSNQGGNNRDKLDILLLLSKVNKKEAAKYLAEYVHLNDSLQTEERKIRNKFTRIRFETDEYIEETEKLSKERILILFVAIVIILVLSFAYFLRVQRARNKELVFEKEQQKANEEIFSLMLKQQSKLEEGRLKERFRISEDLHDGVLGKIFGTRLGLGFLNIKGDKDTLDKLKFYVDELQTIEKEIRTISHELKNEILTSKEDFFIIIEDLIKQKAEIGSFEYRYNYDENIDWDGISDSIKINFYRIIQESLQNIIKYAKANNVSISINLKNNYLTLVVTDNGVGFKVYGKKPGIGIKNMKSRTKKIKGNITVESEINLGTTITVTCPIKP